MYGAPQPSSGFGITSFGSYGGGTPSSGFGGFNGQSQQNMQSMQGGNPFSQPMFATNPFGQGSGGAPGWMNNPWASQAYGQAQRSLNSAYQNFDRYDPQSQANMQSMFNYMSSVQPNQFNPFQAQQYQHRTLPYQPPQSPGMAQQVQQIMARQQQTPASNATGNPWLERVPVNGGNSQTSAISPYSPLPALSPNSPGYQPGPNPYTGAIGQSSTPEYDITYKPYDPSMTKVGGLNEHRYSPDMMVKTPKQYRNVYHIGSNEQMSQVGPGATGLGTLVNFQPMAGRSTWQETA